MKVTSIRIPYCWEDINIENDNLDVFVDTDEDFTYILSFGTPKNLQFLMEKEKMNYYGPGYPFIIVNQLTKEIIEEAVKAFAEQDEGYWLKVYHFVGYSRAIDQSIFDQLKAKRIREQQFEDLEKFDELKAEYKKFRKKLNELKDESLQNQLAEFDQDFINLQKKLEEFDQFEDS